MNSKERMIKAIRHEEPDRVPLGGVAYYDWSAQFLGGALLPHFGLAKKWTPSDEPPSWSDDDVDRVIEHLGIDFKRINPEPPTEFKEKAAYDPRIMGRWGIRIAPNTLKDEWGVVRQLVATKTHGRIIAHPLKDPDALNNYVFPDPNAEGRFDAAEAYAKKWREEYAIVAGPGIEGFFDHGWFLCGFEESIIYFYKNPSFVEKLYDKIEKYYITVAKRLAEMGITIFSFNDDIAGQTGLILSPMLWRKHIKPRIKRVVDIMKKKGIYVLYHSDGALHPIVSDFIEIGIDILNPIQPEVMIPEEIKKMYGDKLTLSGTMSMQRTLSRGTVEDVRNEVIKRIKTCGQNGGLIISPSNNATLDIPLENFLAIYETTKKYGKYPIKL